MTAKKKKSTKGKKRTTSKKKTPHSHKAKGKSLNVMVRINEPKVLRKDVLETLREVIIFMQGYETFRKIQEEKIATFTRLREDINELNSLVHTQLHKHLPKGKLKMVSMPKKAEKEEQPMEDVPEEIPVAKIVQPNPEHAELDELELQLRDIEGRLQNLG